MEIVIKFITALAWMYGGLMAIGVVACWLAALFGENRMDDSVGFIRSGLLPWAWLIARYWL